MLPPKMELYAYAIDTITMIFSLKHYSPLFLFTDGLDPCGLSHVDQAALPEQLPPNPCN